jgi:hypothetical protein
MSILCLVARDRHLHRERVYCFDHLSPHVQNGHPGESPARLPIRLSGAIGEHIGQGMGKVIPLGKVLCRLPLWGP